MPRPILATIDTQAMAHNLRLVNSRMFHESIGGSEIFTWAVIKARGYGHGIEQVVRGFADADGLAMLDLSEAILCRELGWTGPILLLEGFFQAEDLEVLERYRISSTIHSFHQLEMLKESSTCQPIDVFVKLNSGMHRLGFQPDEYAKAYAQVLELKQNGIVAQVGKMTHFAKADEDQEQTQAQLALFNKITADLPGMVSVCNSAASLTPGIAESFTSGVQWVRPGICLYGSSPFANQSADALGLIPTMTLSSELISTHTMPAGDSIGYGHTFTAEQDMRVGIVACGYADGYPRHAVTGTPITIDGVRTCLVGRVSMDMLAVDLSPIPTADIGSSVILWGQGGPSIDEVAQSCGTIGYELMCALAERVPRKII